MIAIDATAFVAGLCVGDQWVGDPDRGRRAWRDTGLSIVGPAVTDVEAAFADAWAHAGPPLPPEERTSGPADPAGEVALRVVASMPRRVASYAWTSWRVWPTEGGERRCFVGGPSMSRRSRATRDGVDVQRRAEVG
jgi:cardiolipin synthase